VRVPVCGALCSEVILASCAVLSLKWTVCDSATAQVSAALNVFPVILCVFSPALHEFPTDLFTNKERTEGAVALHVLFAMYMFCALALVCDDYFVPSLEKICERLHLSEDVAGATFMAAGSSAPELFTSVIGVFITKGDVGVGTIVGSAVFNILCIIGVCGIFAGQAVHLSRWSLLRDSVYYTLSIAALIVVWSACSVIRVSVYVCVYIMSLSLSIFLSRSLVANLHRKQSVLMVDELLSAYPHQLSFSDAGMRIMITSHFSPRTRLTMASRMLITERQRLISTRPFTNGDSEVTMKVGGRRGLENGLGGPERGVNGRRGHHGEDDRGGVESAKNTLKLHLFFLSLSFSLSLSLAGCCNKIKWLLAWPLCLLLFFTVPNCANPRWERWFMVSFVNSTLWIAGFSYVMVWMVTVIGFTLGIPDVIMGITFLAAGTSVPDCMASLIVARQGLGDMAVSNSIGSNVFDILIGLGLPWALQTMAINYGSYIQLNSKGLIFSVGLLLGSVFLTVLGVHLNGWRLDRRLGLVCLFMYSIFLCFSILIEYNIFTFVNLPTCRDR
uniref:Sodium/potassium/calcium exchanger 3-like n=1 Tax=Salmo trutta TaxID=8032 RepID=A0A674AEB3_SALTR